jgi:hypothetical protein
MTYGPPYGRESTERMRMPCHEVTDGPGSVVQISSPVEKYLPNLHNLMYKCSSSVKALTPKNHKNNIT